MSLTRQLVEQLNRMCPAAHKARLGTRLDEAGLIETHELEDGAVTLAKLEGPAHAGLAYPMVVATDQAVRAGRLVCVTAGGQIRETTHLLQDAIGVALADGAATETVQVLVTGVREVPAQRGIGAGQYVKGGHEGAAIAACLSTTTTVATGTGGNFGNQPAGDTVDVVSSSTDDTDQVVTVYGTANDDSYLSETYTLNGSTTVNGTQTFKTVCGVTISAGCAGTVTVSEHSGELTITTIAAGGTSAGLATVNNDGQAYNQQLAVGIANGDWAIVQGVDHAGNALNEVVQGTAGADSTTAYVAEVGAFMIGQCAAATKTLTAEADPDRHLVGVCLNAPAAGETALIRLR